MRIEWNGKRVIVTYDDGSQYNGQYNKDTGRNGIGTLRDKDGTVIHQGEWLNDDFIKEMTDEEYNNARRDW